ncbi:L-aspartate oxidase [Winogradskyella endarachnes]|uniref:L-aspartate oxidase n=1 Tax=Winogradskyella endarachnes TaxID=2681965 RepID=A0A6L6U6A5_9FLAO|nr:L-aspartate oxidase [Winogradskyella endarachnes]MUU77459.1 L-aspartate oxidase [Winogradskyella endarachnes]
MSNKNTTIETDFLVIGSGVSGLTFALKVATKFKEAKVILITKDKKNESNTNYAQGGIATVTNSNIDSFEQHVKDTLIAGDGLCDEKVVKMVVNDAPNRLQELIEWGTKFDKNENGDYDLGREGGHSQNRILHHTDITGAEIERVLLKQVEAKPNIEFLEYHYAIDLITEHQTKKKKTKRNSKITCFGAYVLDQKKSVVKTYISKFTMLASGGNGQVYETTTNPKVATGDGLGMAYRAKAEIADVEFIQFHPTALYNPGEYPAFLISEAVRGFGAKLRNSNGQKFMHNYDAREELASRDIVARAIDNELKKSGNSHVYLDCRHLNIEKFKTHFPNISEKCTSLGIDIKKDFIPVAPASHYICGGIVVNKNSKTSIKKLYACGEVTRTGLHGGNRLASNSLLEGLVYAHSAFLNVSKKFTKTNMPKDIPEWNDNGVIKNMEKVLITHDRNEVKTIMTNYVGIVRSNERLLRAEKRLKVLYEDNKRLYDHSEISTDLCELRNLITTAYLITQFSKKRKKNCGGFFNMDLN